MSWGFSRAFYLIVLLILGVFFYFYFWINRIETIEDTSRSAIEIRKGFFVGYEKGKETYKLWTDKVIQTERRDKILLIGVKGIYFTDKGKIDLSSSRAYLNEKTSYLKLIGNVKIRGMSGEVISSDEIFFNQKTKSVFSPSPFTITSPLYDARGEKMTGNIVKNYYRLLGNVKILIKKEAFIENESHQSDKTESEKSNGLLKSNSKVGVEKGKKKQ